MIGAVETSDADLVVRQIAWASRYDGYGRLADGPPELAHVIAPARDEWQRTGEVPSWCGVDLLRGWAFFMIRADRHGGGYRLEPGGDMLPEWRAVMHAIAGHECADPDDRPPLA